MISGAVRTLLASTGTTMAVLVTLLVVIGLVMIAVAIWLVRSTRTDPVALAPLEVMGERRFRKGDADRRQTRLDTARPPGAPPPAPMVPGDVEAVEPPEPPEGTDPTPAETAVPAGATDPKPTETAAASERTEPPPEESASPPEICDSSVPESARSGHTSAEGPSDTGEDHASA